MKKMLTLCTCPRLDADRIHQLAQHAAQFKQWAELPVQAETQGIGPLVYTYLRQIEASVPRQAKVTLQGLYLRHRRANDVRSQTLAEIWLALQAADIPVLVLKGAALAHLVYDQPGLRPMRDLDLLVKKADLFKAREILVALGFDVPLPEPGKMPDKHLEMATRQTKGFSSSIELHYNLFNSFAPASMTLETIHAKPIRFTCAGVTVCTLGPEDMLLHLCEHIAYHASIWEPIRLIWVVDVVSFAEKFVDEVNWAYIHENYPVVLNLLSLFHAICPLSEHLKSASQIKIGPAPQGFGEEFKGWPRYSLAQLRGKSYWEVLTDTFVPSEWWLRLHYRLDGVQSLFWYRWFFHPFYILGPFYGWEKLKLFWHLKLRRRLGD